MNYLHKPEPKREKKVYVDDRLSPNSLFLVGKSMFLFVHVYVLDGTLRNIFGSLRNVFGHLRILSDPYEKSWHS